MLMVLLKVGGMPIMDRLIWATGCSLAHPRPTIEAFCRYQIPEDLLQDAGLFGPLSQITDEHKRNILANNFARIHGIDIPATKAAIGICATHRPNTKIRKRRNSPAHNDESRPRAPEVTLMID